MRVSVKLLRFSMVLRTLIQKICLIEILDQLYMMTQMKKNNLIIHWIKLANSKLYCLIIKTIITIISSIMMLDHFKMTKSSLTIQVKC